MSPTSPSTTINNFLPSEVTASYSNTSNLQNLESLTAYEVFKADGLSLAESQHINDPHLYRNVKISSALLKMLTNLGPLQPVRKDLPGGEFPKSSFSGTERSFSEVYYKKETNNDTHSRQWLAYSLIVDRVYCWTCRLYGTPKAQNNIFSMTGCNDWKHLSTRLKEHESSKVHLESEISRAMYVGQSRIDLSLIRSGNTQVSKNQEIVRVLMDIILYLSKYDSAFRGHNEKLLKNDSINRGKLTFVSKDSQNAMLEALAETLRDEILQKVKNAGMFSVIIDTTTDNAKIDQLAFVIRYCSDDGEVFERLVGIDEVNDSSGKGMFDVFCELCERYGLNWRKQLIGQAYDGASNMQSELKGLRGYIQAQNPCALHTSKLDFVEAMKLVKATRNELFHLRNLGREQLLECFINEAKTFCEKFELNERNWIWKRISLKKKWMENCQMTKDQIQPKTIL
eukprot:XP_008182269.1 PREDICTED: zinc finger MYM-type protein 1-like [Acyrthosiphon pisum]